MVATMDYCGDDGNFKEHLLLMARIPNRPQTLDKVYLMS